MEHKPLTPVKNESSFDLKKLLVALFSIWPWIIVSLLLMLSVAFVYLRYTDPLYRIQATIQIADSRSSGSIEEGAVLEQLGMKASTNADLEIEMLKSRAVMEAVVREMKLVYKYSIQGRVKWVEMYDYLPFSFQLVDGDTVRRKETYRISFLDKDNYAVRFGEREIQGRLGDTIELNRKKVVIMPGLAEISTVDEYMVEIFPFDQMVSMMMGQFSGQIPNKASTTINLYAVSTLPKKGEDILNKVIEVYMRFSVNDKNRTAKNTLEFIDERLALVEEELTYIEKDIEGFKREEGITDLSTQSGLLLTNSAEFYQEISKQEAQLDLMEGLEKYINNPENRIIPSSLATLDPGFTTRIEKYNSLQLEREKLLLGTTEQNPAIISLDEQLVTLRNNIKNSVSQIKADIKTNIRNLEAQVSQVTGKISRVPLTERIFLDKARQQNIKQELFLFLLKIREETAIAMAANIAAARIVDTARAQNRPFKPDPKLIYIGAFAIGLFIPVGIAYLKLLFNVRVQDKTDIQERTSVPVVAQIVNSPSDEFVQVVENSRSVLSEQFRTLRTNLQFMLGGRRGDRTENLGKVVLVTSSMSGEGKSFISVNLASTLALSEKSVVLLEMDLRKPRLSKGLKQANKEGLSNYFIGKVELDEIIRPSGIHDRFSFVPSGPIPPNPAELLMISGLEEFFMELRKRFDYIVVDSAPVGLVTDAHLIQNYCDTTFYVVRQGYTYKQQVSELQDFAESNPKASMGIIFNDIKKSILGYYGYGYTGYGYGKYGYGSDNEG